MLPFARIVAIAMAAVVVFALVVPMALRRGDTAIAIGLSALFAIYLVANVVLMRRYRR